MQKSALSIGTSTRLRYSRSHLCFWVKRLNNQTKSHLMFRVVDPGCELGGRNNHRTVFRSELTPQLIICRPLPGWSLYSSKVFQVLSVNLKLLRFISSLKTNWRFNGKPMIRLAELITTPHSSLFVSGPLHELKPTFTSNLCIRGPNKLDKWLRKIVIPGETERWKKSINT